MSESGAPPEVASMLLDYTKNSKRAVASRSIRVKSPATNGNTFQAGNQIIFRLPSNVKNTFLDFENSYLRLPIVTTNDNASTLKFEGKVGAYGLINKIEILSSGQTISSLENYAELVAIFSDLESNATYKKNQGKILFGMNSSAVAGDEFVQNTNSTYCLPLLLTPLTNLQHYWPLFSRDSIEIRITLNSVARAFVGAEVVADNLVSVTNPEFVQYHVEVNNEAMDMINSNCGGVYSLNTKDFRHTQYTVENGVGQITPTLGFSMSSLETVFIGMIASSVANSNALASLGSRGKYGLNEVSLLLNGERIPQRQIKADSAEALAELMIRERSFGSFHNANSINENGGFEVDEPAGNTDENVGNYLVCVDTETMRPHNESGANALYAGISTVGQTLQADLKFDAADPGVDVIAHFYGVNTINLTLDMNGTQTWVVSV